MSQGPGNTCPGCGLRGRPPIKDMALEWKAFCLHFAGGPTGCSTTVPAAGGTEPVPALSSHTGRAAFPLLRRWPRISTKSAGGMASFPGPPPEAKSLLSFLQGWLVGETVSGTLLFSSPAGSLRCLTRTCLLTPAVETRAKWASFLWVSQSALTRSAIYRRCVCTGAV